MQYADELKPVDLDAVRQSARDARGYIDAVYLHWSAGRYGQIYEDYHISIDKDGRIYYPDDCGDFTVKREHTYHRNSNSIGIAICGCFDAQANSGYNLTLGSNPITDAQIEAMAAIVAIICKEAFVPLNRVLTHCEAAFRDGYGPFSGDEETRWDLWFIPDSAYGNELRPGGEVLRGKAAWYMQH